MSEMRNREGPKFYGSCIGCAWYSQESYNVQGDSGFHMYCNRRKELRRIPETRNARTPDWCPVLTAEQWSMITAGQSVVEQSEHEAYKE